MSFAGASGAAVSRIISDRVVEFLRPKRNDVGKQIAAWAAEDRLSLLRLLKESGAGPEIRLAMLRQHDQESRRFSYGLRCLLDYERATGIVREAFTGGPEIFDELSLSFDQVTELAYELWGFSDVLDSNGGADAGKATGGELRPLDRSGAAFMSSPKDSANEAGTEMKTTGT